MSHMKEKMSQILRTFLNFKLDRCSPLVPPSTNSTRRLFQEFPHSREDLLIRCIRKSLPGSICNCVKGYGNRGVVETQDIIN